MFSRSPRTRNSSKSSLRRPATNVYYRSEKAAAADSPFTKKPPPKSHRRFWLGAADIIILLLVIAGVIYSLMLQPRAKVIASDSSFHPASVYKNAVDSHLRSLNNRSKLTFDGQSISSALQKQFPEITNVQVELPIFSETPTFRLTIAKPSFMLNSHGTNYIISSNGVAVAKAQQLPGIKNLTTVTDQSGFDVKTGSLVLSSASASFINSLIGQCRYAHVPVASLTLPPVPQELYLRTTDQPYFVKFYLGGDALDETGQFLAARKHFAQSHNPPSQYLDVRVVGKIFYK